MFRRSVRDTNDLVTGKELLKVNLKVVTVSAAPNGVMFRRSGRDTNDMVTGKELLKVNLKVVTVSAAPNEVMIRRSGRDTNNLVTGKEFLKVNLKVVTVSAAPKGIMFRRSGRDTKELVTGKELLKRPSFDPSLIHVNVHIVIEASTYFRTTVCTPTTHILGLLFVHPPPPWTYLGTLSDSV
ncbi:hypothetical protein CHS0354_013601 [Potamilus streckersoni]|uniref:Uncharacterized protein n=1 Tax=Potamilus streckersoni TaxID=2493646 RepID=A0AAE0SKK0_9BIVA|nr:hypothetical protein CHS0354_013601 [Potamilus streckersoni]